MTVEIDTENAMEPIKELVPQMGNTPIAPAHGIAAIALSLALRYHDTSLVKDGSLYQQYKLEGKNFTPLTLSLVLETAAKFEAHLLGASERIASLVVDAISEGVDDAEQRHAQDTTAEGAG